MNTHKQGLDLIHDTISSLYADGINKSSDLILAIEEALSAANLEIGPGWRDIEDHPHDRTIRPLARPGNPEGYYETGIGHWHENEFEKCWVWDGQYLDKPYHVQPTHYRDPLPQPITPPRESDVE